MNTFQEDWLNFIFSPQFEFILEACCALTAFILLSFLSQSGVYLTSSVNIFQSAFKPQY